MMAPELGSERAQEPDRNGYAALPDRRSPGGPHLAATVPGRVKFGPKMADSGLNFAGIGDQTWSMSVQHWLFAGECWPNPVQIWLKQADIGGRWPNVDRSRKPAEIGQACRTCRQKWLDFDRARSNFRGFCPGFGQHWSDFRQHRPASRESARPSFRSIVAYTTPQLPRLGDCHGMADASAASAADGGDLLAASWAHASRPGAVLAVRRSGALAVLGQRVPAMAAWNPRGGAVVMRPWPSASVTASPHTPRRGLGLWVLGFGGARTGELPG